MKAQESLLVRESRLFHPLIATFAICLLSGCIIYFDSSLSWWSQFNLLGHILIGILFTLLCLPYIWLHFRRTLGVRRPGVLLSGLLTAFVLLGLMYTGLDLAIFGHQENKRAIIDFHFYISLVTIALIVAHLFLYKLAPARRDGNRFHSLTALPRRRIPTLTLGYFLLVSATTLGYQVYHESPEVEPITQNYEYIYGNHPFRPSQTETAGAKFVSTSEIAGSDNCASCHFEIAKQWFSSTHRQSASDPAYVTNINLLEKRKGISATRYCEGCHAPIALLTGQLTDGGQHGGVTGTPANLEGVNCVSCHRITHAVHLEGVASYHFEPARPYLFQHSENLLLRQLNSFLINVSAAQHRTDMTQPVLSQPTLCATCHAQFMDADMNDWGWIKMQDDYNAWLNSPYSHQHQQNFANESVVQCLDCHMPLVEGRDPSANSDGLIRSHRFAAANTMLPLLNGDQEQLEAVVRFLRSNKMNVSIEPPNRKSATQNILNLDESLRSHPETPDYHYLGETVELNVIVSNTGVGHDFPAGTIDINEAWVDLVVRDAEDQIIYHSGVIDENDILDSAAHRYLSIPVNRQGKAVWQHDLFNMIGETFRNVVKAGESDVVNYQFEIPYWAKGPLTINATLKYRKLNTRYAKWALKEKYRKLPIVDMARDSEIIEVRHEPKVGSISEN